MCFVSCDLRQQGLRRPDISLILLAHFCSTSMPITSTRWFNQHIQASHTLRSAVDKYRQHQELVSS